MFSLIWSRLPVSCLNPETKLVKITPSVPVCTEACCSEALLGRELNLSVSHCHTHWAPKSRAIICFPIIPCAWRGAASMFTASLLWKLLIVKIENKENGSSSTWAFSRWTADGKRVGSPGRTSHDLWTLSWNKRSPSKAWAHPVALRFRSRKVNRLSPIRPCSARCRLILPEFYSRKSKDVKLKNHFGKSESQSNENY